MASTVEVLCPNGRRQNVKITPNSKLLQILEDVCKKQGFDATDYDLRYGRKTLDLSLSFRFSGLPNNSRLELVKAEQSRVEEAVHIALDVQAADGSSQRLQGQFPPGTALWDILMHFQKEQSSLHLTACDSTKQPPEQLVCNYLTEQVMGESALKATTLKSLGLTGGRAVLRLLKRQVDPVVMQEIEASLQRAQARQERLEAIGRQKREEAASSSSSSTSNMAMPDPSVGLTDMQVEEQGPTAVTKPSRPQQQDPTPMDVDTVPQNESSRPSVFRGGHTGGQFSGHAGGQFSGQPSSSNQQAVQALRNLGVPGLEVHTPDDFYRLSPQEQQLARQQMKEWMTQMGMAGATAGTRSDLTSATPSQQDFVNFKFPEETKGKDLYHNELSEYHPDDYQPCERQALVFSSEDTLPCRMDADIDEDFFELTDEDVKRRHHSLQQQLSDLKGEALMTKAMRERRVEEIYSKYPRIVIRVVFPDKMVLQCLFRPMETVHALKKFVQDNLQDKNMKFELYTTPPKQVLSDDAQTMIKAHLAPASNVYFKTDVPRERYLGDILQKSVTSRLEAEKSLGNLFPTSENGEAREPKNKGQGKRSSGTMVDGDEQAASHHRTRNTGGQPAKQGVPKWLKLGK